MIDIWGSYSKTQDAWDFSNAGFSSLHLRGKFSAMEGACD